MNLSDDKTRGVLQISGILDIDVADALREALLGCFARQQEITLDLSQVTGCDASALQILMAGRRDAASLGVKFRILAASPPLTQTASALGLLLDDDAGMRAKDASLAS